MTTTLFTDGWTFRRRASDVAGVVVRLPHDAMISEARTGDAGTGNHGGYFPGGAYDYWREWAVPADAEEHEYSLLFEGVYGNTRVLLNGREVGRCDSGYREFSVPLSGMSAGENARIEVHVDNTHVPNSRWYTGSGIYRPVWLQSQTRGPRISHDGVHVTTRSVAAGNAIADVLVRVDGDIPRGAAVTVEFRSQGVVLTEHFASLPASGAVTIPVNVHGARPWSAETPFLYDVVVTLSVGGVATDTRSVRTGLRTIEIDARHGLRVNGVPTLLRGACVHHDNGVLGAVTLAAAEHRRARLLKEAGYNAIRSSHNPLSRAFLDACDELGLYVMDELTDVWFQHKTPGDGADRFTQTWRDDADAMIAKDRNRPSVILYSIGNEIAESTTEEGVRVAQQIHRHIVAQDPTRPTTLAVNLLLNLMAQKGKSAFDREEYTGQHSASQDQKVANSTAANMVTAKLGSIMQLASLLPAADKAGRGALSTVDVAGYNYAYLRYARDRKKYPERVLVGSESMPGDLPSIWKRVTSVPGIIGDFMWTGWDYLGEAGIGSWSYGDEPGSINKPYPALVAGCGVLDITGQPGAPALLIRAVWDEASAPGIAVRPLDRAGKRANKTPWRSTDAVPSWSWRGLTGKAEIEVYSPDDYVELRLNGRSLGRKRAGRRSGYVARFTTLYEPGELIAIGFTSGGAETSRSVLRSASRPALTLRAETSLLAGPDDLAYVWIELADGSGVVDMNTSDEVTVAVSGPATLAGLGSAATSTEEGFTDAAHTTYRGRALAVIRGTVEAGEVVVTVGSRRHGTASLSLVSDPSTAEVVDALVAGKESV